FWWGKSSCSANCRTVLRNMSCSGVKNELMIDLLPSFFQPLQGRLPLIVLLGRNLLVALPRFLGLRGGRLRGFQLHHLVGGDALSVDLATLGRVIAGNGELQARTVAQIDDGLHRSLSEGLGADQGTPLIVLKGPRHDFGPRGAPSVPHPHRWRA